MNPISKVITYLVNLLGLLSSAPC